MNMRSLLRPTCSPVQSLASTKQGPSPGHQEGTCPPWAPDSDPPSPLPAHYQYQGACSERRRPPRPMNLPGAVMRSASMGALASQLGAPADVEFRIGLRALCVMCSCPCIAKVCLQAYQADLRVHKWR